MRETTGALSDLVSEKTQCRVTLQGDRDIYARKFYPVVAEIQRATGGYREYSRKSRGSCGYFYSSRTPRRRSLSGLKRRVSRVSRAEVCHRKHRHRISHASRDDLSSPRESSRITRGSLERYARDAIRFDRGIPGRPSLSGIDMIPEGEPRELGHSHYVAGFFGSALTRRHGASSRFREHFDTYYVLYVV
jgi:hypothetical protein